MMIRVFGWMGVIITESGRIKDIGPDPEHQGEINDTSRRYK